MELPLVKLTVEPLRIQRVVADVARDLGYEPLTTEQADAITAFLRDAKAENLLGVRSAIFYNK